MYNLPSQNILHLIAILFKSSCRNIHKLSVASASCSLFTNNHLTNSTRSIKATLLRIFSSHEFLISVCAGVCVRCCYPVLKKAEATGNSRDFCKRAKIRIILAFFSKSARLTSLVRRNFLFQM